MATVPVFYGDVSEPPLVQAFVFVDGVVLNPRLTFFVDTAAQTSLIVPGDEALLKERNPQADLDNRFTRGAEPVATILGMARFKYLRGNTGITVADLAGNPCDMDLDYLYFADERAPLSQKAALWLFPKWGFWKLAGEHAEYSILGRDVLQKYALYSCLSQRIGFLTNAPRLKEYLGQAASPVADAITYFEGDPWAATERLRK